MIKRRPDWGSAILALLLIVICSFLGTLAAGILLLLAFSG